MKNKIILLLAGALFACSSVGFCAGHAQGSPSTNTKHSVIAAIHELRTAVAYDYFVTTSNEVQKEVIVNYSNSVNKVQINAAIAKVNTPKSIDKQVRSQLNGTYNAVTSVNPEIAYVGAMEKKNHSKPPKSILLGCSLMGAVVCGGAYQLKNPPNQVQAAQNVGDEDALESWMKEVSGLPNAPQLEWQGADDTANISLNADGSGAVTNVKQNDAYIVWDATNKVFVVTDAADFTGDYEPVPAPAATTEA